MAPLLGLFGRVGGRGRGCVWRVKEEVEEKEVGPKRERRRRRWRERR